MTYELMKHDRHTVRPQSLLYIGVFHVEHPPSLPQAYAPYLDRKRTISSEMSAGLTPLIRLAWPKVLGWMAWSF